ncbi:MAG TPA: flagellar biosynthetic protein FliQ [Alphaproteobacteria bacterium]|nr:flagellar biosynthetic protein FliQ [Alphaproteobacteria bacterium]
METLDVIEIAKEAIFVMLKVSLPILFVALVVGLIISLIQALTQIQEMTISFVPKIICIFVALILMMPLMIEQLKDFTDSLMKRIENIE